MKKEDELLKKLVEENGPKSWSFIAQHLQGRIGKQCRERSSLFPLSFPSSLFIILFIVLFIILLIIV